VSEGNALEIFVDYAEKRCKGTAFSLFGRISWHLFAHKDRNCAFVRRPPVGRRGQGDAGSGFAKIFLLIILFLPRFYITFAA